MTAGFIGGGRWLLNLVSDGRRDVWEARWDVGNRKALPIDGYGA
jgi:hypothetical protein